MIRRFTFGPRAACRRDVRRMLAFVSVALVAVLAVASVQAAATKVINGTPGNDTLRGTKKADTIYGRAGDDTIYGRGGNDLIVGGPGTDSIYCGTGVRRPRRPRRLRRCRRTAIMPARRRRGNRSASTSREARPSSTR